jgi:hypothetical protein
MCKPGSACCGCGVTSSGLGIGLAVLGIVGAVSMASAFVSAIVTTVLVGVFSIAAGGAIMLVVVLRRTRGVVTWPMRVSPLPAAGRRPASVQRRVRPAPHQSAPGQAVPVAGGVAGPAIPARQRLAIEAPAPAYVRAGLPAGSGGLATAWLPERLHGDAPGRPAPEADRPRQTCPDWTSLAAAEITPDHGELPV